MKRQAKNHLLVHVVGALTVTMLTILLIVLVVLPLWRQREDRARLVSELTGQIASRDRMERLKRALSTQVTSINEAADKAALPLKLPNELNQQLALIAELASNSGVQVESLEPAAPLSNARFRVLPVRLSGKASYLATNSFFASLRQQLPDTSIRAFRMHADNSTNPPVATISMDLLWCTKPDVVTAASSSK